MTAKSNVDSLASAKKPKAPTKKSLGKIKKVDSSAADALSVEVVPVDGEAANVEPVEVVPVDGEAANVEPVEMVPVDGEAAAKKHKLTAKTAKKLALKLMALATPDAVNTLVDIMNSEQAGDKERMKCAELLLERVYGKGGLAEAEPASVGSAAKNISDEDWDLLAKVQARLQAEQN